MIAIDSRRNHVALNRWPSVGGEHLEAARRVMQSVTAPPLLGIVSTLPG